MSLGILYILATLTAAFLPSDVKAIVVKHSFPFDSYRITCPREYAIQKASLQVVQSVGRVRTDYLLTVYCERVSKLFPFFLKTALQKMEDECRWTHMANLQEYGYFNATCGSHEYLSGLSRRGMNRYVRIQSTSSVHGNCLIKEFVLLGRDQDDIDMEEKQMIVVSVSYL
ncbi:hypothetical protein TTRE_0000898801 [Trichuris trichiura]|uniref:Uncharacterized protein n=1 Tax=Trichuris trichiura TaxID=36087 RepID=A0A077ZLL0_TRITR|nr:hypothetical protein TTRE_0000898801 [Trichuris trichiura]